MAEPEKPNWGNRVILLVFIALAVVTIGATIFSTMGEWEAVDETSEQAAPADAAGQ